MMMNALSPSITLAVIIHSFKRVIYDRMKEDDLSNVTLQKCGAEGTQITQTYRTSRTDHTDRQDQPEGSVNCLLPAGQHVCGKPKVSACHAWSKEICMTAGL